MQKSDYFEKKDCPICEAINTRVIDVAKTINTNSDLKFQLVECSICKHWWHSPMPHQDYLNKLYEEQSEFVVSKNYFLFNKNSKPLEKLDWFGKWIYDQEIKKETKTCLEVGVGNGLFLNYLNKNGFECHGIDPGNWNPELKLYATIKSLPLEHYDFIVMSDVLEHLENPTEMLKDLYNKSHKNTTLYCSFPNKDSIPARLLRSGWSMVVPLGHLHYFSYKSVRKSFSKTGWRVEKIKAVNARHNSLSVDFSIKKLLYIILKFRRIWKDQFWVKVERC